MLVDVISGQYLIASAPLHHEDFPLILTIIKGHEITIKFFVELLFITRATRMITSSSKVSLLYVFFKVYIINILDSRS